MEAAKLWDAEELLAGPGIVDYVVGAAPGPGVFVLGTIEHPRQRHYLNLYKLGEGPIYCFYTPYHLCHFEVPTTIARAALFGDAAIAPLGAPCVEVVAVAKRDLKAGEVIDELGGYLVYGEAEAAAETARGRPPADRRRRGREAQARPRQGRRPHLRRRGAPRGPAGRQAPRRAGGALRPRALGGVRPPQADQSSTARPSTRA